MSLETKIMDGLKEASETKDKTALESLRAIKSATQGRGCRRRQGISLLGLHCFDRSKKNPCGFLPNYAGVLY